MGKDESAVIQRAMELFGILVSETHKDELIRVTGYIEGILAYQDILTKSSANE